MRRELENKMNLQVNNVQAAKGGFMWPHTLVKHMAALTYTGAGQRLEVMPIRNCHSLIKQRAGMFSDLRGNMGITLAAMLSLCPDPEHQLDNTITVQRLMKGVGFRSSDFRAVAAYQIAANAKPAEYEAVVARAWEFYRAMKAQHILLTGQNDYIFAAMLALSGISVQEGAEHMEALYRQLKPHFYGGDRVQALSQVLAVSAAPSEAVGRVLALREAFRAAHSRMDGPYTLSMLGILALLPQSPGEIAADVVEVYNALRGQKGFGAWSLGKAELMLFAAALVAYADCAAAREGVAGAVSTNVTNLIIAQEAAIIAVMAATTVTMSNSALSSASSSS